VAAQDVVEPAEDVLATDEVGVVLVGAEVRDREVDNGVVAAPPARRDRDAVRVLLGVRIDLGAVRLDVGAQPGLVFVAEVGQRLRSQRGCSLRSWSWVVIGSGEGGAGLEGIV
jgi:hypothetical protein